MQHRHLTHQDLTLAAIDDIISRSGWRDWVELRAAALSDSAKLDKIARVLKLGEPAVESRFQSRARNGRRQWTFRASAGLDLNQSVKILALAQPITQHQVEAANETQPSAAERAL